jgi:hypothetical protein
MNNMNLPLPITCQAHTLNDYKLVPWRYDAALRKELKFSVLIPQAFNLFKSFPTPPSVKQPFVDCAYFKSPDGQLEVIVQSSFMESELSLQHYLEYLAHLSGETIEHLRLMDDNPDQPDVLVSRKFSDGQTWMTRRMGYKVYGGDCAVVIVVHAAVNLEHYARYAEVLYCIASSLQPLEKPSYALAEKLRLFSKKHPGDFATYIPESWQELHHHNNSMKKYNAVFTKKLRNKISGVLNISTLSVDEAYAPQVALKRFHEGYVEQGMQMHTIPLVKSAEMKCFNAVLKGEMEFPAAENQPQIKNLITFYIAENKGSWFYIEMFGPARDSDFEAWAINWRALNLVIEHFKVA